MKNVFRSMTLLVFAFSISAANADLLLEPYLGYYMGKNKMTGFKDASVKGLGLGGRIGFQKLGFMFGADAFTGKWSDDSSPSNDYTPTQLGVFAGYNFPVLVRAYAVYNFYGKMKDEASSVSKDFSDGSGIKLGVGFTGLPFVSVNVEYAQTSYKKYDGSALANKLDNNMLGVTVSLPLTF